MTAVAHCTRALISIMTKAGCRIPVELSNMIIAQRAYEVNSRAVKAADDMLSQINNLTR